jgi:hypothetical protein
MGRAFDSITDAMRSFIDRQHVFFVATAPRDGGHVNLSPKGHDSFRVLSSNRVAFLDLTGSGAETIAHLRDDGRITFMFCAFEGKPNIVRFYGRGRAVLPGEDGWDELVAAFDGSSVSGDVLVRSIVVADIDRTSTSCGYAVPFMDFVSERDQLVRWGDGKTAEDIEDYWAEKNATSIDGLPALSA